MDTACRFGRKRGSCVAANCTNNIRLKHHHQNQHQTSTEQQRPSTGLVDMLVRHIHPRGTSMSAQAAQSNGNTHLHQHHWKIPGRRFVLLTVVVFWKSHFSVSGTSFTVSWKNGCFLEARWWLDGASTPIVVWYCNLECLYKCKTCRLNNAILCFHIHAKIHTLQCP